MGELVAGVLDALQVAGLVVEVLAALQQIDEQPRPFQDVAGGTVEQLEEVLLPGDQVQSGQHGRLLPPVLAYRVSVVSAPAGHRPSQWYSGRLSAPLQLLCELVG
jgi:hypothetical protein